MPTTLVTGGAGYIGCCLVEQLLATGRGVRVLDILLHGQEDLARGLEEQGAEVIRGDVRDASVRARALDGVDEVVHLAAIVGDPACARDPEGSQALNVDAALALAREARDGGVRRFVFASTCSNYGRMADPTVPITEEGELAPVSLYATQKVEVERALLGGVVEGLPATCLRFATVYGVAPRMRFDLTVNEFTRDLWADRELEVFGEQFWRPYVHTRDAARAIRTVLDAPDADVVGEVYNVGRSGENYRKLDLVEAIQAQTSRGKVTYVRRDEDPRDYKVSFDKVRARLGFETESTVPEGIGELLEALDAGAYPDPWDGRYRNIP
ncbi:NAD-dependent epimerase/dehydratase family protein [Conexibacter arvalis]|uniref:Nucleoside-diphosphate-sugar epimerase n=1 Tax=Conexibacter arvalis TaxID=912552 RepID=A0A840I9R0_9ACTN|nr:NAD-dependent epimerase/dehydratase family protein [Conexibacter arvalis]MBB4661657.1 nucleoside-diphosphate-sugar epimerase [Conexibacter arvalis]